MSEKLSEGLRARIAASAPIPPGANISVAEEGVPVLTLVRDPATKTGFDEHLDRVGTAVGVCSDGVLVYAAVINTREEIDPLTNTDVESDVRSILNVSARYRSGNNVRLVLSQGLPGVTAYISLPADSGPEQELLITSVDGEVSIRNMPEFIQWARNEVDKRAGDEDGDEE